MLHGASPYQEPLSHTQFVGSTCVLEVPKGAIVLKNYLSDLKEYFAATLVFEEPTPGIPELRKMNNWNLKGLLYTYFGVFSLSMYSVFGHLGPLG